MANAAVCSPKVKSNARAVARTLVVGLLALWAVPAFALTPTPTATPCDPLCQHVTLDPERVPSEFPWQGGDGCFSVLAPYACSWAAVPDFNTTILSGHSGCGNGAVCYRVEPNVAPHPASLRITVADQSFSIYQHRGPTPGPPTLTPTPSPVALPSPTATCPPCVRLGSLSVSSPSVSPSHPAVGDTVTLSFPVAYMLPSGVSCGSFSHFCLLQGGETYLEGDEIPRVDSSADPRMVVVQRRVVRAGVTTVALHLEQQTEDECYVPPDCQRVFTFVPIEASSPPFELSLSEPTPTLTPTGPADSSGDGGGCQMSAPGADHDLRILVMMVTAVGFALRRRSIQPHG
jgi:hypothetical protein